MSEQPGEHRDTDDRPEADPGNLGSLSVEDEPGGTENPADLAGTRNPDDADVATEASVSEADDV
jgi:hypothetical protein